MIQFEVRIFEMVEHIVYVQCDTKDAAAKQAKVLVENGFYGDDFVTVHTKEYSEIKVDNID
jgi:hypothetical protein